MDNSVAQHDMFKKAGGKRTLALSRHPHVHSQRVIHGSKIRLCLRDSGQIPAVSVFDEFSWLRIAMTPLRIIYQEKSADRLSHRWTLSLRYSKLLSQTWRDSSAQSTRRTASRLYLD